MITHVDNEAAVLVLNSGHSKESQIMHLVRCLFFILAHFQLRVRARHIPGVENVFGQRRYARFCESVPISPYPTSEMLLCQFVARLCGIITICIYRDIRYGGVGLN